MSQEILPGFRELMIRARLAFGSFWLLVLLGGLAAIQCSGADEQNDGEREASARRTAQNWANVRARRATKDSLARAFNDSLAAIERSAPAVAQAVATARAASQQVAAARDTTTPILVDALAKNERAVDSLSRQLSRTIVVLGIAQLRQREDSLERIDTDATLASLQADLRLANEAIEKAAARGRMRGQREGVLVTTLVLLLGVILL